MLILIKQFKFTIIGVALGAVAGLIYWSQVGCSTGTCMITSHPVNSSVYGAFIGALIGDSFRTKKQIQPSKNKNE